MKHGVLFRPVFAVGLLMGFIAGAQAAVERDIVVYGGSSAGLAAAVQAKRMGLSVVVVSPDTRIGGLTTGGLGQTDYHCVEAYGGIALEFYRDVARHYAKPESWTREKASDYTPDGQCEGSKLGDSMWTFEPSAALGILEGWVKRDGLDIRRGEYLDRQSKSGVEVEDGKIKSIKTLSGNEYRGKMFVDATYEGDLMAAAGVSYAVGRESNATYGETNNGIENRYALFHQFVKGVDPYVVKGDPSSGLLPGVEPYDPKERDGAADRRVQAYCFRLCLTDVPENRIPFKKPEGYDERDYELLFRNFEAGETVIPWINSRMPNRKTDTNNRKAFSSDFIGGNWRWPEASYAERDRIFAAHLKHQKGLMWTLANHPRVPAAVRAEVSKWGTCKDEFLDGPGDGWQSQLYVREARRLVGEYVVTEHDCRGARKAPRPVALAAYGMDSHNVRRRVGADGFVHNEGDVEDHRVYGEFGPHADKSDKDQKFPPYGIDYGALVPKRGECANLLVPVCVSASHMAYGSIRMEPVFFELGQVAGTAAALAIGSGSAVQDVDYAALRARLEADGQKTELKPRTAKSEIAAAYARPIVDRFVKDARAAYATPAYAAYTNTVLRRADYARNRVGTADREPWTSGKVRWIDVEGACNVRDIGGWTGLKEGMVFRGSELDTSKVRDLSNPDKAKKVNRHDLTEKGRRVMRDEMRIRCDLDLRRFKGMETAPSEIGPDVRHCVIPISAYTNMLRGVAGVAACLRVFADPENYPVYVHCAGGADRTGSILFLLEGLCGVSEPDLNVEYELTSFGLAERARTDRPYYFASLVKRMKACPGANLNEQIEWYALNELKLTQDEIATIRQCLKP